MKGKQSPWSELRKFFTSVDHQSQICFYGFTWKLLLLAEVEASTKYKLSHRVRCALPSTFRRARRLRFLPPARMDANVRTVEETFYVLHGSCVTFHRKRVSHLLRVSKCFYVPGSFIASKEVFHRQACLHGKNTSVEVLVSVEVCLLPSLLESG